MNKYNINGNFTSSASCFLMFYEKFIAIFYRTTMIPYRSY